MPPGSHSPNAGSPSLACSAHSRPQGPNRCLPLPPGRRLRHPLISPCMSDGHQNDYALVHFIHTNPAKCVPPPLSSKRQRGLTFHKSHGGSRSPRPTLPSGPLTIRRQACCQSRALPARKVHQVIQTCPPTSNVIMIPNSTQRGTNTAQRKNHATDGRRGGQSPGD